LRLGADSQLRSTAQYQPSGRFDDDTRALADLSRSATVRTPRSLVNRTASSRSPCSVVRTITVRSGCRSTH